MNTDPSLEKKHLRVGERSAECKFQRSKQKQSQRALGPFARFSEHLEGLGDGQVELMFSLGLPHNSTLFLA